MYQHSPTTCHLFRACAGETLLLRAPIQCLALVLPLDSAVCLGKRYRILRCTSLCWLSVPLRLLLACWLACWLCLLAALLSSFLPDQLLFNMKNLLLATFLLSCHFLLACLSFKDSWHYLDAAQPSFSFGLPLVNSCMIPLASCSLISSPIRHFSIFT